MGGGGRGKLAQQEPLGFAVLPPPFDFFFFPFFPPKESSKEGASALLINQAQILAINVTQVKPDAVHHYDAEFKAFIRILLQKHKRG